MAKKGYWIAHVNITNPDRYKDYVAANAVAFKKYNARFVVRAGESIVPKGRLAGRRPPETRARTGNRPPVVDIATIILQGWGLGLGFLDAKVAVTVYFGPQPAKLTVCRRGRPFAKSPEILFNHVGRPRAGFRGLSLSRARPCLALSQGTRPPGESN